MRIENHNYKLDISFIMPSYLKQYGGSRSEPVLKFKRAVQSVIDQNDPYTELIIVSDGCEITQKIYDQNFKHVKNVKFIFIDKNENQNLNQELGKKYFRGVPRQVGRSLAEGYVTAYIDSDDFIRKDASSQIKIACNKFLKEDKKFMQFRNVYLNEKILTEEIELNHNYKKSYQKFEKPVKIEGLNSKWCKSIMNHEIQVMSTWTIIHKSDCIGKWKDTTDIHEDMDFINQLKKEQKGNQLYIPLGYYVICHSDRWDF